MTTYQEWLQKFSGSNKVKSAAGAINSYYNSLRVAKTPYNISGLSEDDTERQVNKTVDFASKPTRYSGYDNDKKTAIAITKDNPHWYYRYLNAARAKENADKDTVVRVSLNVRPDVNLIKTLDQFLIHDQNREYIRNYKSPSWWNEWLWRHDPVTIYLWKSSPKFLKSLTAAVAPYVREGPEQIGTKIADGIYLDDEPTKERTAALFLDIKKSAPEVYDDINEEFGGETLSAGQYHAIKHFTAEFLKNRANIKMPTKSTADNLLQTNLKLLAMTPSKKVTSRNGKIYRYFTPARDKFNETAHLMKAAGLEFEKYDSDLYPEAVLRVEPNEKNIKTLQQIHAFRNAQNE